MHVWYIPIEIISDGKKNQRFKHRIDAEFLQYKYVHYTPNPLEMWLFYSSQQERIVWNEVREMFFRIENYNSHYHHLSFRVLYTAV